MHSLIQFILSFILAALIAGMGYDIFTWQWWAVLFIAACMSINGIFQGMKMKK